MKRQVKRLIYLAKERVEELQIDLEEASNATELSDKRTRDKLVWARAKTNDLLRLLNTIK